jgi:hypothetical protein
MLKQDPLEGYQSRGSIVNVTSLCSTIAMPGLTAFSGTQGGILGLTKTDALDFGPQQIRINCVAPGNVVTSMMDTAMGEEDQKSYASRTPLRRLGQAEDIANAAVWLSSPMAAYITGISLPVDGGFCLVTGPPWTNSLIRYMKANDLLLNLSELCSNLGGAWRINQIEYRAEVPISNQFIVTSIANVLFQSDRSMCQVYRLTPTVYERLQLNDN